MVSNAEEIGRNKAQKSNSKSLRQPKQAHAKVTQTKRGWPGLSRQILTEKTRPQKRSEREVLSGTYTELGATPMADGVNFALYSKHATAVYLLLFDRADGEATDVIPLPENTQHIWHGFVKGLKPGQLYGYKVDGPFQPHRGHRFNPNKFLIDPYAKALTGRFENRDNLLLGYQPETEEKDLSFDGRESTPAAPRCVVVKSEFDWQDDKKPDLPMEDLVFYEVHVKGFTAHPSSGVKNAGTYLGFIEKIPYLKEIGVNAVELLPIQAFYPEDTVVGKGLTNYWGYNTLAFFAPEPTYGSRTAPGCEVDEFKTLVRELHKAGIEVILDVVYNHTPEGNEMGPTVSFRGLDNLSYYHLAGTSEHPKRYYMNHSGCGNSLDFNSKPVIRLTLDSLRYWVEEMHVDGFRFDLATSLGRGSIADFRTSAPFFMAVAADPVLRKVKLIAEPWDMSAYEVGNFPSEWMEWNGRFRDNIRKFVKGDGGQIKELGYRLTGSADLYADDGRKPANSVNFITCHDGFTLNDLISYNEKHNEANLEGNGDGANDNHSWNCGVEGETTDTGVIRLRRQQAKNFMCCLLLSQGSPMVLAGDEFLRTQKGNNNGYCQDNEISWIDWTLTEKNRDFLDFFKKVLRLRKGLSALHRRKFLLGVDRNGNGIPDLAWFGPDQKQPHWDNDNLHSLAFQLDLTEGDLLSGSPRRKEEAGGSELLAYGDRLYIILNLDCIQMRFILPQLPDGKTWSRLVDTSRPAGEDIADLPLKNPFSVTGSYIAEPRSVVVLLES